MSSIGETGPTAGTTGDGGDPVAVRRLVEDDWAAVAEIYRQGIAGGTATFETDVPSWEAWDATHLPNHRLVATTDGGLVGWAALSSVSDRCAYAGVAEVSIYVAEDSKGAGVGRRLLEELIAGSERDGMWTLQAGMFPDNEASVRLHQACGFRIVGRRERIGQLGGYWRDVLLLERRSSIVAHNES